ncbi:MAG: hypothetical protein WAO58_04580 [Fimbriimonadaceae bacterium]
MKLSWIALPAAIALISGCTSQPVNPTPIETEQRTAIEAVQFRYQQRLSEDGTIPPNALMNAKAHRDAMLAAEQPMGGGAFPASWSWIGPGRIGGRLRAIIIHPTQTNTIWIGSAGGGIWKTTDGGSSWVPLDDFMASLSIGCMAIDPTNPNTLYAGTGEGFFEAVEGSSNTAAIKGYGIYKTTDGGTTWNQLASTADWDFVNRLAIHPTNGNIIWAATNTGIYKSLDGGSTWTLKSAGDFLDVKLNPSDPARLLADKSHTGVFFSNNGGETWTQSSGITGDRFEIAYAPSNPATVYVARSLNSSIRIFRSTDGGQSFSQRAANGISTYNNYNSTIWVDPTNANTLVYGGVNLYRSTDGGASRTNTFTGVHSDMHAIVNDPGFNGTSNKRIYVGCDGGIYRITDAYGSSSTRINNNISLTQFYGAAVHDGSGIVVAGAQDNGTNRYTGNPMDWDENVIGGDGTYAASDPTNANYWYAAYQWMSMYRSSNGGLDFNTGVAPPGSGDSNNYNFIPYFMLDPNNPSRMLACGEFLWRSNNIKTGNPPSWTSIKPSTRPPGPPPEKKPPGAHMVGNNPWNISTVAVAEGNSDLIWAGHNDGRIYKTTNGTLTTPTWQRMDDNPTPLPNRWISRIVIDRNNHNRVYVSFMGWAPDNVWRTTDGGNNWEPINGSGVFSLPPAPVGALAVHRTKPGWLYAGTDIGIFTSSDDGLSWTTRSDGPNTVPMDEFVWRNDNVLMAVTHGRGIYFGTLNTGQEPFAPDAFLVSPGRWQSGRLQELFQSDNKYLVFQGDRTYVELTGTAPIEDCATLQFTFESHVSALPTTQSVRLFDFVAGKWVNAGSFTGQSSDVVRTVNAPGLGSRFIEPGTRRVRARIETFHPVNGSPPPMLLRLDQVFWKAML